MSGRGLRRRLEPATPARHAEDGDPNATIAPMTIQKFSATSKNGIWKFMPITPARTTAGQQDSGQQGQDLHRLVGVLWPVRPM